MPWTNNHGGRCCGVTHIAGIGSGPYWDGKSKTFLSSFSFSRSHLYEIVLTDHQMEHLPKTLAKMKQLKFKRVSRFLNSNSGNYCNVFHKHPVARKKSPEY